MAYMNYLTVSFLIGLGSVAPGVSGGSMAIAFGIYERIVGILTDFRNKFKEEIGFLLPLAIGGMAGISVFVLGLNFLFDKYEFFMRFLFAGIMLGTFPSVYSSAVKEGYKSYYPLIFIFSMLISLFGYQAIRGNFEGQVTPIVSAISGGIIGIGTVIPGISASAVLMALGLYKPLLASFAEFNIAIIIPAALGFLITVAALLKAVEWLFSRYHGEISFVLFGLLGSSVAAIVPKIYKINLSLILSLLLSGICAFMTYVLENRIEFKKA